MVRRLISGVGRTLITTGVLLLLFVAYQLWGTGLKYNQLQDNAGKEFAAQLAASGQPVVEASPSDGGFGGFTAAELSGAAHGKGIAPLSRPEPATVSTTIDTIPATPLTPAVTAPKTLPPVAITNPPTTLAPKPAITNPPTTSVPAEAPAAVPAAIPVSTLPKVKAGRSQMKRPKAGSSLGRLVIPAIKKDLLYVAGAGVEDLKAGPGHYSSTAFPGLEGNVGIACHRTTYGAPCFNLNLLKPGDIVGFVTLYGKFAYKVEKTFLVGPKDRTVLAPTPGENVLTITTCHPAYTARQRLVVRARLVGEALEEDLVFEPEVVPVARPKPTVPTTTAAPATIAASTTTPAEPLAFDTAASAIETDGLASETTVLVPDTAVVPANASDTAVVDSSAAASGAADTQAGVSLTDDSASRGSGPVRHFGWFTGKQSFWISTLAWAGVCAAIWLATWLLVRNRRRAARALVYTLGFFLLFLPALYFCFENLTHLLPENV
jgi:LPXTG-site transpeptidase (sortase) family protein